MKTKNAETSKNSKATPTASAKKVAPMIVISVAQRDAINELAATYELRNQREVIDLLLTVAQGHQKELVKGASVVANNRKAVKLQEQKTKLEAQLAEIAEAEKKLGTAA